MANMFMFVAIGFLWGFIAFFTSPHDKDELRKEGAIQVYENRMKCEKAMNIWVCDKSSANQNGER